MGRDVPNVCDLKIWYEGLWMVVVVRGGGGVS